MNRGDWKFRDYYSSVKRTYSKINISEDEDKIKKQLKPYKIIFDFEKYYNYIKKIFSRLYKNAWNLIQFPHNHHIYWRFPDINYQVYNESPQIFHL